MNNPTLQQNSCSFYAFLGTLIVLDLNEDKPGSKTSERTIATLDVYPVKIIIEMKMVTNESESTSSRQFQYNFRS